MTGLLPAEDLFPSEVLFPSAPAAPTSQGVAVTLNGLNLTGVDGFGIRWRVSSPIDGWDGSPGSSLQPTQKTRAPGAWPSPRELTPRSIGLTGAIEAPDTDAAVGAMDRLNAAASLDASILTITRGSLTRSAIVYRQGAPAWTEINGITNFGWTLDLIALEPRKFATALVA
jgi:hypothetical protein